MPKGYQHLAYDIRCQIYALLKRGDTQLDIAQELNISQSTISREIKRNTGKRGYRYKQAQRFAYERRRKASSRPRKMTQEVIKTIRKKLENEQWSPEQLSAHLKEKMKVSISTESIYKLIWTDKQDGGALYKHLRCSGKRYNKRKNKTSGRGLIPDRVGIEKRPTIVDQKVRVGDFEVDTIVGSKHHGAIVSVVDRKTKVTFLELIPNRSSVETANAMIKSLDSIKHHVFTITADNGKEFAQHKKISKALGANVYFANPYSAWERGLNENTNGLVRQYFPKKTDFTKLTREQVKEVEHRLNTRPRKTLGFKTPFEVFLQLTGSDLNYALRN